ncbi:S8 family serine peptidase [Nonomuraea rhodomycinica]|uniref:S8 family serine peptidase n=1 Tax=Nonomuraea rhodomycinica TaxID=1712872 RepID=A0A7Y6IKD6_9ACTN|nr:S8 family serine peptidase [Nonomuraea rhodomycinica]NUW39761.1 S8 family serine peptidase [Nonomuraea rhodomycinica]
MRDRTKAAGVLILAAAILPSSPASAAPASATAPAFSPVSAPVSGTRTVTLITGDRVTVTGGLTATIRPAPGREDVAFRTGTSGGRLSVVPSDVVPLLGAGRLDPRLFEVSTLLEYGYDDRRAALPLIVTGAARPRTLRGGANARSLAAIGGYAVQQDRKDAARFWQDLRAGLGATGQSVRGGSKVWLDGLNPLALDTSVPRIGAPAAWARGLTGAGVKVAVLDSGVDATHPDLAGKVAARADFTEEPDERDVVGHGTHVASTIAGSGAASGGRYRGVAPDATLLDGKVCASRFCSDSAILAGMQWAAEQGAQVVNLSLGRADTPEDDPLEQAVRTLTERYGTLFVVAAGNDGADRAVSSPASSDAALAVGAVDGADALAPFSNRGPRVGDGGLKPDITAPGVDITAARGKDSPGTGPYVTMSGTSMATPHVAGTAALVAGAHPGWKAGELKAALMASAKPDPRTGVFGQGAGRVDADHATTQTVTAWPAGLGYGVQSWPHGDDQPVTRTLTYRNHGDRPVTLTLEARAGAAFTVTPRTLTVPAGGTAEATVTSDTRADAPDGFTGGHVVATGPDGLPVSTPVGVEKEVESYDLTIEHTGRSGAPTADFEMSLARLDAPHPVVVVFGGTGTPTSTFRLPKGTWLVDTAVLGADGVTRLVHPGVALDRDRTVRADARLGRPISIRPPASDATLAGAHVVFQTQGPGGQVLSRGWIGKRLDRIFTAQLGPDRAYDGALTLVTASWLGTDAYRLAWVRRGGMITGFDRAVTDEELAVVRRDYARHLPDAEAEAASVPWPRDGEVFSARFAETFATPSVRTEHVNTDDGVRWRHVLDEYGKDGRLNTFRSAPTRYPAGRVTEERWNRGVFGPSLPYGRADGDGVSRTGDEITADLWLFGDGRGSTGWSSRATEHTALYRDGGLVGEAPSLAARFAVPAGQASYRLLAEAVRGEPATLSTRVSAAWTFRSGRPATAGELTRLPVSVVTFAPALDAANTAPAGRRFTVPVSVRALPGSGAGRNRELAVEVSYDDGATWAAAEFRHGRAVLRHPAGDGFVSLRARAVDTAGDAVEQTVIRAYRIAAAGH